jgi:FAD:protein FMN transferase
MFGFDAIGTSWEIETERPLGDFLQHRILERIERFDAVYSRFRPDSLVSRMAAERNGGSFAFPDDAAAMFALYDRLHAATDGAIDPLVGHELELLGYDPAYSLCPATDDIRAAARAERPVWARDVLRDGCVLTIRRGVLIDVGAAGKGYLVDIIAGLLEAAGHRRFVVDGGGDLRHAGEGSLRVGLEHPFAAGQVIGVANLRNAALCASAINRRAWGEGLHHVLDARLGSPVRDVVATWAMANDALTADGLATALFFMPGERLAAEFDFSFVRMFANGRAEFSPDFDGELFFVSNKRIGDNG